MTFEEARDAFFERWTRPVDWDGVYEAVTQIPVETRVMDQHWPVRVPRLFIRLESGWLSGYVWSREDVEKLHSRAQGSGV